MCSNEGGQTEPDLTGIQGDQLGGVWSQLPEVVPHLLPLLQPGNGVDEPAKFQWDGDIQEGCYHGTLRGECMGRYVGKDSNVGHALTATATSNKMASGRINARKRVQFNWG